MSGFRPAFNLYATLRCAALFGIEFIQLGVSCHLSKPLTSWILTASGAGETGGDPKAVRQPVLWRTEGHGRDKASEQFTGL